MTIATKARCWLPLLVVVAVIGPARARAGGQDEAADYQRTGQAVQIGNHWPFRIEICSITHEVKRLPAVKSSQAVIDLEADKRLTLEMLRDIDMERFTFMLRAGYRRNGYDDVKRVTALLQALSGKELKKGDVVTIRYDPATKVTRLAVKGGETSSVEGVDFMRATWSLWFGKTSPSDMGEQLASLM